MNRLIESWCFIVFSLFIVSACTDRDGEGTFEKRTFSFSDFNSKKTLNGKDILLDSLLYPASIEVIPERNLLIAVEMDAPFFGKVFTLDSMRYLTKFAEKGKSPNALLSVFGLQYVAHEEILYLSDIYGKKLFGYHIDSILSLVGSDIKPIKTVDFSDAEIMRPVPVGDEMYVDLYSNVESDSVAPLAFYNAEGQFVRKGGDYPSSTDKYNPIELFNVFMSGLNTSADGRKILVNYSFTDCLDIYDAEGQLEIRAQGPDVFEPVFRALEIGGVVNSLPDKDVARRGYLGSMRMKDDHVLALYSGKPVKDSDHHVETLLSFSDQLIPSTIYRLDKPIFYFDVDWSARKIYGLTHDLENNIVVFDLDDEI